MAWESRADGDVAGLICVHMVVCAEHSALSGTMQGIR
jgi:hypothetical protein